MNNDFYERCKTVIAKLDLTYEQGIAREVILNELDNLEKQNKQLKDNWEIIRQYCLDEQIPEESDEYNSYIEFSNSVYDNILNKMQELEQGKDESN